jgi:arsenate reductase (thioredoxin)
MKIAFLCVANSARSQMAEGLARNIWGMRHAVFSAGSQPTKLNPLALRAMQEIGVDITHYSSKGFDALPLGELDYVVTLCAEEVCPHVVSPAKRLHWPTPDPASVQGSEQMQMEAFRDARDAIAKQIRDWGL